MVKSGINPMHPTCRASSRRDPLRLFQAQRCLATTRNGSPCQCAQPCAAKAAVGCTVGPQAVERHLANATAHGVTASARAR